MDNIEIREIVENEGLDYAIEYYMGSEKFDDRELAQWWDKAQEALKNITDILHLDDY